MSTIVKIFLIIFSYLIVSSQGVLNLGTKGNVLVVLDDVANDSSNFSSILNTLQDYGMNISKIAATNDKWPLLEEGELLSDYVMILLNRSKSLPWSAQDLISFIEANGNLLVAIDDTYPIVLRSFLEQFSVFTTRKHSVIVDHFQKDELNPSHQRILTSNVAPNKFILKHPESGGQENILYEGTAFNIGSRAQLTPILNAEKSSYIYNSHEETIISETPESLGTQANLVSVFQSNIGSRLVLSGSKYLFSDRFISHPGVNNGQFVQELFKWTLRRKSIIKCSEMIHHNLRTNERNPSEYRIGDLMQVMVNFSIVEDNKLFPFVSDDVQVELTLLDPYIRTKMEYVSSSESYATYQIMVKIPDKYGLFKVGISLLKEGLTPVSLQTFVKVRQHWHDEFPRFLLIAYPYYTCGFISSITFLVFLIIVLHRKELRLLALSLSSSNIS